MLYLLNKIITGYTYSTIIFLLLLIFNQQARTRKTGFLNLSNALILIVLSANLFVYYYYGSHLLFIPFFLGFLFQLCFVLKKFRIKIWTTIVSVLLLLAVANVETILSFFRDYLPSSWAHYSSLIDRLWELGFSALYFVICWVLPKRKTI